MIHLRLEIKKFVWANTPSLDILFFLVGQETLILIMKAISEGWKQNLMHFVHKIYKCIRG